MGPERLGRFGEDLVARLFGYRRQPFSGGRWPFKEDLVREVGLPDFAGSREVVTMHGDLAQVKTTRGQTFVQEYQKLEAHALAEGREACWYEVVVTPREVYVFEKRLIHVEPLGVAAVGTARTKLERRRLEHGRTQKAGRFQRKVQDDHRAVRRRGTLV